MALAQPASVSAAAAFGAQMEPSAAQHPGGLAVSDKAWQLHAQGDIAAALATLDAAIGETHALNTEPRAVLERRRAALLRAKAWLLAENYLYGDAALLFRDLTERDPDEPEHLLGLGEALAKQSDPDALAVLQRAERAAEARGDDGSRRRALIDIGDRHLDLDQRAEAAAAYAQAFAIATARAMADPDGVAEELDLIQSVSRLAEFAGAAGEDVEHARRLQEMLQRAQALVDRAEVAVDARTSLAAAWAMHGAKALNDNDAALALDRFDRSSDLHRSVLRWRESLPDLRRLAYSLRGAAVALGRLGQTEAGLAKHTEAAATLARVAPRVVAFPEAAARLAAMARDLALASWKAGDLTAARRYLEASRDIVLGPVRHGAPTDALLSAAVSTLADLIVVLIDGGDTDAALHEMMTLRDLWPAGAADASTTAGRRLRAEALDWLTDRALALGEFETAQADILAARAALDPLYRAKPDDETVAVERLAILAKIGQVAVKRQDEPTAIAAFSSTIREADRLVAMWPANRSTSRTAALARLDMADVLAVRDLPAARRLAGDAVDIFRRWCDGHAADDEALRDLAAAYTALGRIETDDAARIAFDASLQWFIAWMERAPAERERLDALARQTHAMADFQFDKGAIEHGLTLAQQALTITQAQAVERFGDASWHRDLVVLWLSIARGQDLQADYFGRLGTLESALVDAEVVLGSQDASAHDYERQLWLLDQIANAYAGMGDHGTARANRERALAAATAFAAKAGPEDQALREVAYAAVSLAELYLQEDLSADALVLARYGVGLIDAVADDAFETRDASLTVFASEVLSRALLATDARAEALGTLAGAIALAQHRHEADPDDIDRRKMLMRLHWLSARAGGIQLHIAAAAYVALGLSAQGALSAEALRPYEDGLAELGHSIRAAAELYGPPQE